VNYGGSSGYGRKYRERLRNRWGVVDTDDCITSVQELSTRLQLIDPKQVCIRGGSAGGFTTYSALSYGRYQGVFAAGTSIYGGVADLRSLATNTHKFELYYTNKFVGGALDDVRCTWIYKQRSPLTYAEDIKVPLMVRSPCCDHESLIYCV
jgi:dipeptidyl aminopeptidase/acylaminoacyl peptidase